MATLHHNSRAMPDFSLMSCMSESGWRCHDDLSKAIGFDSSFDSMVETWKGTLSGWGRVDAETRNK
jgi:hypothetical protein